MTLSITLQAIGLIFATVGVFSRHESSRLKLNCWILAYIFVNLSILTK